MSSIFSTIATLFRAKTAEVNEAVRDANGMDILKQNLRDAESALNNARVQHTEIQGKLKVTQNKVGALQESIAKYTADAVAQGQAGNQELAVKCMRRVQELRADLATEEQSLQLLTSNEATIAQSIKKASDNIKRMTQQIGLLEAQGSVIAAQTAASSALNDGTSSLHTAAEQLERTRAKQELQLAKLASAQEQQDIASGADLDRELAQAKSSKSAEDELAELLAAQGK